MPLSPPNTTMRPRALSYTALWPFLRVPDIGIHAVGDASGSTHVSDRIAPLEPPYAMMRSPIGSYESVWNCRPCGGPVGVSWVHVGVAPSESANASFLLGVPVPPANTIMRWRWRS